MIAVLSLSVLTLSLTGDTSEQMTDEPAHTVVLDVGDIQIRDYEPMILAQVTAYGSMQRAGNAGFRPLADYIFGNNSVPENGEAAEIAMTTPVTQTRSTKIDMTTPVTQTQLDSESWQVSFVMPAEWRMETLPVPNNASVELIEMPARRMAAIRFSGGPNEDRFERKFGELLQFLNEEGYQITGEPIYARYDPPWIPTFLRRNEVMIEVAQPSPNNTEVSSN